MREISLGSGHSAAMSTDFVGLRAARISCIATTLPSWQELSQLPTPMLIKALKDARPHRGIDMTVSLNPYRYSAVSEGSVRLLKIEPAASGTPITINLTHHFLDSTIEYEALSYVWGAKSDPETVICGARDMLVTKNLHAALINFRDELKWTSYLWIDAICIDQSNAEEKTTQVGQMFQIYRQAKRVLVWLGPSSDELQLGYEMVERIFHSEAHANLVDTPKPFDDVSEAIANQQLEIWGLPKAGKPEWATLNLILSSPWFSRIWILQEMFAHANCDFINGSTFVSSVAVFDCIATIVANPIIVRAIHLATYQAFDYRAATACATLLMMRTKNVSEDLATMIVRARYHWSSDPRDKIFALVSLSSDADSGLIDYTLSTAEVFLDATKHILITTQSLDYLTRVTDARIYPGLPTWVPMLHPDHEMSVPFTLIFPSQQGLNIEIAFGPDDTIQIEGVILDSIKDVNDRSTLAGMIDPTGELSDNLAKTMTSWFDECLRMISESSASPNKSQGQRGALWRALVLNRPRARVDRDCPDLAESFADWEAHLRGEQHLQQRAEHYLTIIGACLWVTGPVVLAYTLYRMLSLYKLLSEHYIIASLASEALWKIWGLFVNVFAPKCAVAMARAASKDVLRQMDATSEGAVIFTQHLQGNTRERNFCVTSKGYMGWVRALAQPGDYVCCFKGCRIPFVIRRSEYGYELIGDAYVHGFMDYEIWNVPHPPIQSIELI